MELDLCPIGLEGVSLQKNLVIAGPCSAETEDQVMNTAIMLANNGIKIFRAGIWKSCAKAGSFEGVGVDGLAWLKEVKKETGMYISTEVATAQHVYECLKADVDILWLGARTTTDPFAVQEIAEALKDVNIPVLVKNPVVPDIELWIGALQRLNNAGIKKLGCIHQGFSSYDIKIYRNLPQWHIPIDLRRRIPNIPLLCDPSHMGGKRELIASLCQQAMDLGFDGLIIESHNTPDKAWSDAFQQITPDRLNDIISSLVIRKRHLGPENLEGLRSRIDSCDDDLMNILARRMCICREIGILKRQYNMKIFQKKRIDSVVEKYQNKSAMYEIDANFIKMIIKTIHKESIRQQMKICHEYDLPCGKSTS